LFCPPRGTPKFIAPKCGGVRTIDLSDERAVLFHVRQKKRLRLLDVQDLVRRISEGVVRIGFVLARGVCLPL
jgi:hypothetical protein